MRFLASFYIAVIFSNSCLLATFALAQEKSVNFPAPINFESAASASSSATLWASRCFTEPYLPPIDARWVLFPTTLPSNFDRLTMRYMANGRIIELDQSLSVVSICVYEPDAQKGLRPVSALEVEAGKIFKDSEKIKLSVFSETTERQRGTIVGYEDPLQFFSPDYRNPFPATPWLSRLGWWQTPTRYGFYFLKQSKRQVGYIDVGLLSNRFWFSSSNLSEGDLLAARGTVLDEMVTAKGRLPVSSLETTAPTALALMKEAYQPPAGLLWTPLDRSGVLPDDKKIRISYIRRKEAKPEQSWVIVTLTYDEKTLEVEFVGRLHNFLSENTAPPPDAPVSKEELMADAQKLLSMATRQGDSFQLLNGQEEQGITTGVALINAPAKENVKAISYQLAAEKFVFSIQLK